MITAYVVMIIVALISLICFCKIENDYVEYGELILISLAWPVLILLVYLDNQPKTKKFFNRRAF